MKTEPKLILLSTFANDKIINKTGVVLQQQLGGPAKYLTDVFKEQKLKFKLISPKPVTVEIKVSTKDEMGKILRKPSIVFTKTSMLNTQTMVISSLLRDFNLSGLAKFKGNIFLDIQGYVREGKIFGKKRKWKPSNKIASNIFCLKGTKQEVNQIPQTIVTNQKKKMLISTNGKSGVELYTKGKYYKLVPKKIVNTKNTIGAGDTFFGYFITSFLKTNNAKKSVQYATTKTSNFLKKTNS